MLGVPYGIYIVYFQFCSVYLRCMLDVMWSPMMLNFDFLWPWSWPWPLGSGHTFVHHSSTFNYMYMPNFIEIEETFVDGRTDVRTYIRTDGRTFETLFIRSTQKRRSKNGSVYPLYSLGISVSFSTLSTVTALPSTPAGTRASNWKRRRRAAGDTVSEVRWNYIKL